MVGRAVVVRSVRLAAVLLPVVALLATALMVCALWACGSSAVTDANEPNDELSAATPLAPSVPLTGVIGSEDSDIFAADAPKGGGEHAFMVTLRTVSPHDLELSVGASIPGVWEGITWPGWETVVKDDGLEVAGGLRKGTVLLFLKGIAGTAYSIAITWE
jgi:hypothetical protein